LLMLQSIPAQGLVPVVLPLLEALISIILGYTLHRKE